MAETHQEPLRVALAGTGFGARVQLPALLGMGEVVVVALYGRHAEKARAIAAEHGVRAVYTDFEQMLDDVQPDVVSISTPPALHFPMTMAALRRGIHVLCEKPFAMSVAEAEQMVAEAQQRGLVGAIDHEFRYLPARTYQRVLVDQGYVGGPVLLEATFLTPMRWDPERPWNWWMDAAQGGGLLGAIGSHFIDAFRWLTGREVRAVTATLHTTPQYRLRPLPDGGGMREVTSDDQALLSLEFEGGLRGVIHLSAVAAGEVVRLGVHGTEGALVVEDDRRLIGRRRGEALQPIAIPPEYEPPLWVPDENILLGPFARLMGLMVDQIGGQAAIAPPSFADGLAVQRVLDAARQSAAEGRRIALDANA